MYYLIITSNIITRCPFSKKYLSIVTLNCNASRLEEDEKEGNKLEMQVELEARRIWSGSSNKDKYIVEDGKRRSKKEHEEEEASVNI